MLLARSRFIVAGSRYCYITRYLIKGSCEPTREWKVMSGSRNAVFASNFATRIRGRHAGMKGDLKGILSALCLVGP